MNRSCGFSILEMLMVMGLIAILSAIAIPNLIAARIAANEASAIASLNAFLKANYDYNIANGTFGTPAQLRDAGYVDEQFGTPMDKCGKTIYIKHGYALTMVPTKLERRLSSGNNGNSGVNNGNGNVGQNNNSGDTIVITEYYMDAVPLSVYEPTLYRTGIRWFYIDSITNTPWVINDTKQGNPCSPGVVCYDETNSKPQYEVCTPLN